MLAAIEKEILERKPDWVLTYGDTNSTLAGALAASKLNIPIAHVEAGLRSFNRAMPEEINRIVTDHLSALLFCPSNEAIQNLQHEGITAGVFASGDVMYDAAILFGDLADPAFPRSIGLDGGSFFLVTLHRAENTDSPERLEGILTALDQLAAERPLVLPIHPRTKQRAKEFGLEKLLDRIKVIEPVSFLEMAALLKASSLVLTDSGGVQKEAYFHRTPCVTMRDETEWVETVRAGWNTLVGADTAQILEAANAAGEGHSDIDEYGVGTAANFMVARLRETVEA